MKIPFLGTGTSHGIPVIGCHCEVCSSEDSRDQRTRASIVIEMNKVNLLVDAAPELRLQLLKNKIDHIDAMLLTHAHADHLSGLDDVRIFSEKSKKPFPIYGPAPALKLLRERFGYIFRRTQAGGGKPKLTLHAVSGPFDIEDVRITPIPLWHGKIRVFGYRIQDAAYCTDVSEIPASSYSILRGLKVLVLDALRHEPHATHFHLERALAEVKKIKPQAAYFTHLCHVLKHATVQRTLPRGVQLAFDGLQIKLT
jgi:phosphoribosyl 1,2-cyclic phosphate phosphodiesterase